MFLNQNCRSSLILRHCLFKQPLPLLRSSNIFSLVRRKPIMLDKTQYKLLYNFPFIRIPATMVRSGQSVLSLSVLSSPLIYYYVESVKVCVYILAAACTHYLCTLGLSKFSERMVGKIYVSKDEEVKNVMFSSLDKYGRRVDRIHNAEELINCEYANKFTGILGFVQINVQNSDLHYKVNVRNCKIHNMSAWENLFGKSALIARGRKQKTILIDIKKG